MNRVAGYRVMLGMKQKDVAEILNLSRQSYCMKENNHIPFKDGEKIILKELFMQIDKGITIDSIFFER